MADLQHDLHTTPEVGEPADPFPPFADVPDAAVAPLSDPDADPLDRAHEDHRRGQREAEHEHA